MPKYLIHVGPHKTGTTYLQLRFDAARARLREQGVCYPDVWSSSRFEPSHRKLVVALRERRIDCLRAQFAAIEREHPEHVLISAEGISHLHRSAIEALGSLTRGHPATVILYVRRWSELLPSLWQETVKHGHDETFPEFLAANMADPFKPDPMNPAHAIERYAAVFGRANIAVVSYSQVCDEGIDIAEHFFDAFLPRHRHVIDGLPRMRDLRPNRSLPPCVIEIVRALNSMDHAGANTVRSSRLRDWYFAQVGRFDLTELHAAIEANLTTTSFSDASSLVRHLHETLFTTCRDLLVEPVGSASLFDSRAVEIPFAQPLYLANPVARQTLDGIYRAYLAESGQG